MQIESPQAILSTRIHVKALLNLKFYVHFVAIFFKKTPNFTNAGTCDGAVVLQCVLIYSIPKGIHTITICNWNCRGYRSSVPYIRELCDRSDIVLICEHWLHANKLSSFDDVSDNICYLARASNESNADAFGQRRGQGGVSIIWHKNMVGVSPMLDCVHDRVCGIRIQNKKGAVFYIFCVYLPAKGCSGDLKTCLDELSGIIENTEIGSNIIISGDFNVDMGSKGGIRNQRRCTRDGKIIYEFMCKHNLFAANLSPNAKGPVDTFHGPNGSSCIDYALISNDISDKLLECITLDHETLNTSDHNPIIIDLDLGGLERNTISMDRKGGLRWNKIPPPPISSTGSIFYQLRQG